MSELEQQQGIMLELQKAYAKMVDEHSDLVILSGNLKKENKQLRKLLDDARNDCNTTQESLDSAQREIERLVDAIEAGFDLVEGEGG